MPLDLPALSEFYSDSENQVTFILDGHTAENPRLLIFDRKPTVYQNGQFSTPSMRIRVLRGLSDADSQPISTKVTLDLTVRWPNGTTATDVTECLADLNTVLGSTSFVSELFTKQQLPRG